MAGIKGKPGTIRAGQAFVELYGDDSKLQRTLTNTKKRLESFGTAIAGIGAKMVGVSAMLATPFAFAIKMFADFDDAMRMVRAVSSATAEEFKVLTAEAERLGRETSFMAKDAAEGMISLARIGFKPMQINAAIGSVLNLARATGTDLGQAAEIAANNMRVFDLGVSRTTNVVDILTATANNSAQTLIDLAEGLRMAGPQAASAGDDIRNVAASLGVLANMGIKGSLAGTALRKAYSQFAKVDIQSKLKAIGNIDTIDKKSGNLRAMPDIMADIAEIMNKMPSAKRLAFAEEIFDLRGALAGLLLGGNIEQLRSFIATLKNVDGVAEKTAAEMEDGIGGAFRHLESAAEGVKISVGRIIGEAMIPYIDKISTMLISVAEWAAANKDVVISIAKGIGILGAAGAGLIALGVSAKIAAKAIGLLSISLKVASLSMSILATPMGATVATIGLFGIAAGKSLGAWQKFSSGMKGIWKDLSKGTDEAFGAIYKAFQAGDLAKAVSLSWETIKTIWTNGMTAIANKLDEMKVGTQNTLDALRTDFFNLGHEIGKFFDGVALAIAKTMYKAGNIAKAMTPLSGMNMHQAKLLNAKADGKFQRSEVFDRLIAENDEKLTGRIGERDRALRERQGKRLASAEAQREKLTLLTDEQVKELAQKIEDVIAWTDSRGGIGGKISQAGNVFASSALSTRELAGFGAGQRNHVEDIAKTVKRVLDNSERTSRNTADMKINLQQVLTAE